MPFNSGIFIDLFIYLCIYLQLSLFKGIVETNSLLEACSPLVNCYSAKAIPGLKKKQVSQCQNIYEHAIWYVKSNIKTACYFMLLSIAVVSTPLLSDSMHSVGKISVVGGRYSSDWNTAITGKIHRMIILHFINLSKNSFKIKYNTLQTFSFYLFICFNEMKLPIKHKHTHAYKHAPIHTPTYCKHHIAYICI